MGGQGEGHGQAWLGRGTASLPQLRPCRFPGMNCFASLPLASSQSVVGPSAASHVSTPASGRCREGLCCSTEGLGAIRPMGYLGLYVYIYMVLILSPSAMLCGASKHLGVPWSSFHQHPNTTAPTCSCFPLSLGSNPWRSQPKEGSELSSPPVHAKRRLPAHLDLHAVMQPFGCPKCQQQTGECGCLHSPRRAPRPRSSRNMCCVTF